MWSSLVARPFSPLHIQTIKILRWGRPGNEAGAVTMIAEHNSTAFLSLLLTMLPLLPSCTLSIYPPPCSISPSLSLPYYLPYSPALSPSIPPPTFPSLSLSLPCCLLNSPSFSFCSSSNSASILPMTSLSSSTSPQAS